MANKQQTAVEWLIEQIKSDQYQKALSLSEWMKVFEQAKEMEKEQIKEVFIDVSDVLLKETDTQQKAKIKQAAEQYYNETFKSE